jgi:nuclease HARBI1
MAELHPQLPVVTKKRKTYDRDLHCDPLDSLTDLELYKEYRMDKTEILFLVGLLKDDFPEIRGHRGLPLQPHIIIMSALLYLATNAYQIRIARSLKISQSSVSRCITAFAKAFSAKVNMFIKFPSTPEEKKETMQNFFTLANFPKVISVIDGTHIQIVEPSIDAHQYRCRKGYPSINVQLACDAKGLFTNIVCRWPGSCHDSYILRNSELFRNFENGLTDGIILGDSGYPCRPWLLTPYLSPHTDREKQFNFAQKKTRVMIECAIGRLKRRFGILHQEIRLDISVVPQVIASCVMLHNLIIMHGVRERVMAKYGHDESLTEQDGQQENDMSDNDQPEVTIYQGHETNSMVFRNHVAMQMFGN